jgi:RNA polymerase sigma factor (sigma-70 family)
MTTTDAAHAVEQDDSRLVAESLAGSKEAFRLIVERYQTLICSLAYSATGDIGRSEDVAQETFINAWRNLRSLREPGKLRGWLCGIVRNRIQRSFRDEGRDPVRAAGPLDEASDAPAAEAPPSDQAVSREEEAILWRSLGRIPENYREPLVLYYRMHQSVAAVAAELELSEDAVRQRLSRGRGLLEEEVRAFTERALRRSAPGPAFSGAVLGSLPAATASAVAAGTGAKGAAIAKSGLLFAWLGPMAGLLGGFLSQWAVVRAHTPVPRRRAKLLGMVATWACLIAFPIAGEFLVGSLGRRLAWSDRARFASVAGFWGFYFILLATWNILNFRKELAACARRAAEAARSQSAAAPLTRTQTALLVVGLYVTVVSGLLSLTYRLHDWATVLSLVAFMPVLSVWNFFRLRSQTAEGTVRGAYRSVAWCCALVLAALNLRLDGWIATARGISVADVHRLLPYWMVHALTLALVAWCWAALALTRPRADE